MQILVFAGNYNQAYQWAKEQQLSPHEWTFVLDRYRILGLDVSKYKSELIGTWNTNPGVVEAYREYKHRIDIAAKIAKHRKTKK